MIRVDLPAEITYLPGSTRLKNGTNPDGIMTSDNIAKVGINIGKYAQQGAGYVSFAAKLAGSDTFPCGSRTLAPLATVLTSDLKLSAETIVRVQNNCG